jgi:signal transduction histidine kinase
MVEKHRSRGAVDLWGWTTITSAETLAARGGSRRQLRPSTRIVRYLLGVAAFAGAYYVAAQGGYALQFTGSISAIWPPVGFAAAVLYLGGLRWWPGAVIGDLLSNDGGSPVGTTIAVTVANLAEVTVMTLLLWRLIGRRARLDTLAQVGRTLAAIAPAVAITATVATVALLLDGTIQSHDIPSVWRTIWIGDASGALVVLPLILVWAHFPSPAWRARSPIEAAAMIAVVVGLSVLALSSKSPFAYVVFPALIWAALRFGQQGATLAVAVAVAAGMAVGETAHNVGPFVEHSITQSALTTQLYIAVAALTTLCLGATVSERQRSASELVEAKRRRLEELRASRRRIVEASGEARRRLERDLHDGAQQRLVSISLDLQLLRKKVSDPATAEMVDGTAAKLREALTELRELAHGIHPALLTDRGLVPALEALADRCAVSVELDLKVPTRLPIAVETAAYFVAAEALTNVAKYSRATHARLAAEDRDGVLALEIADNGIGGADLAKGTGLRGLSDRVAAIDGKLTVDSPLGEGTLVSLAIPYGEVGQ